MLKLTQPAPRAVRGIALAALVLLVAAGAAAWWWSRLRNEFAAGAPAEAEGAAAVSTTVVHLSAAKLQAAGLHASPVERRPLQDVRRVPGKLGYNTAQRLELKLPAAGVVKQALAHPGQPVKRGGDLALLTSVEVGLARDEVEQAAADVRLAEKERDWAGQIADNLEALLAALESRPDMAHLERQFKDKLLGDHRDRVMSAYSKHLLADRLARDASTMAAKGAISERYIQERTSGREVSAASFHGVCEQSRFDAAQHRARTQAALEHAQRLLAVSQQKLSLLVGPFAELTTHASEGTICELVLRSPLDGVVEDRFVADGGRFAAGETLYTVANTETLWVSAQVYERDWAELGGGAVREVRVECPALPEHVLTARVQFVGVTMSAETRAVPLVAELANVDGRLKPGMFVWVSVPVGAGRSVLAVPASAVVRHEGAAFVFVEEAVGRYRRADVTLGLETPEWMEIVSGVRGGERVVDRGAFFLKSELLLEGEEP